MLRIAVCDDERLFLDSFQKRLEAGFEQIGVKVAVNPFLSGEDFWEGYTAQMYDAVFLDIDMPYTSGLEIAQRIYESDKYVSVVFITAHEELVFEALKLQPLNFVRKSAIEEDLPGVLKSIVQKTAQKQKLCRFRFGSADIHVRTDELLYISSYRHVITATRTDGSEFRITDTMYNLAAQLENLGFIQPNSGYLVNLYYVVSVETDHLLLENGTTIPLSRDRAKKVKISFKEYLR